MLLDRREYFLNGKGAPKDALYLFPYIVIPANAGIQWSLAPGFRRGDGA